MHIEQKFQLTKIFKTLGLNVMEKLKFIGLDEPLTIDEAIKAIDKYLSYSSKEEMDYFNNSTSSDIVYEYHHGLGQKIRNVWLWPKSFEKSVLNKILFDLGFKHEDDMSHFLLELFWYYKHFPEKSLEQHQEKLLNEMIIKDILE